MFTRQVKNFDTEPVLRHRISWMSFYGNHGTPPWCLHLLPYFHFLQLATKGPTGLRGFFCPFLGQSPCCPSTARVEPQSGGMAGLGHALPGKSIAWQLVVSWYAAHTTAERQIGWPQPGLFCWGVPPPAHWRGGLEAGPAPTPAPVTRCRGHRPDGHCVTQAGDEALFPLSLLWSPFFWGSSFQIFGVVPGSDNPENPEFKHIP